ATAADPRRTMAAYVHARWPHLADAFSARRKPGTKHTTARIHSSAHPTSANFHRLVGSPMFPTEVRRTARNQTPAITSSEGNAPGAAGAPGRAPVTRQARA